MSGSALADAAGPGKLEVEMMVKAGYSPGFAAALSSTSAIIGPIIPPSIPMVLYGVVSNTSIGYLFMGGVLPGLLLAGGQAGDRRLMRPLQELSQSSRSRRSARPCASHSTPARCCSLPVILLGGIYSGAVTPTEAAAVAAFCALLLAFFWYRTLTLHAFYRRAGRTPRKATGIVALTIAGALVMNWVVAAEQIPEAMGALDDRASNLSPGMFMFVVTILFLVLGAFLDTLLMLLIIMPMLMPTVIALGIDPVHFGVVSVVNMMIGLITPPMGELVFLIAGVTGIKVAEISREIWPFLIVLIALLFVLVYVPQITLWLPSHGLRGPGQLHALTTGAARCPA